MELPNYLSEEGSTLHDGVAHLQEDMGLDFLACLKNEGAAYLKACDFLNKKSATAKAPALEAVAMGALRLVSGGVLPQ